MDKSANWYKQYANKLELSGISSRTQEAYLRAVKQLSEHFCTVPESIKEQEVQDYLIYRKLNSKWAPSTLQVALAGIRYYYKILGDKDWTVFDYAKFKKHKTLPTVLTKEEVDRLLKCVTPYSNYVFLLLVYTCGLRLNEAVNLEVSDIDRKRMVIHIHRGKGAKDRYVPLPQSTLKHLEKYWLTHRNKRFIFPKTQAGKIHKSPTKGDATTPILKSVPQQAMRIARGKAKINKKDVTVHTLRHCYATHLLDSGVNLRYIQVYLGHANIVTTLIYLHLTAAGNSDAYGIIDNLMNRY